MRPGLPGISENIRVISVIGRFLEHSRIYYFRNQDRPIMYVGSADLMPRNIDRRVEVLFPIEDESLRNHILQDILDVYLRDTEKAYELQGDGRYVPCSTFIDDSEELFSSQNWFMKQHKERAANYADGKGD